MVTKRVKSFITLLVFSLLFFVTGVQSLFAKPADEKEEKVFYLNEDNELVQKFTWKGGEYVYRYEFYVEKYNEETTRYEFCTVYETKETELEVLMESGKYRYTIKVYNYLNQMDFNTDWVYFEIIRTYQPVITAVLPTVINLDEAPDGIFIIEGYNLRPETRFTVENATYEITTQTITKDRNFRRVAIRMNPELLDAGNFYIRAVNPGGAFDTSGTIKVTFKQPLDINVSAGYAPMMFPLDIDRDKKSGINTDADSLIEFFTNDVDLGWIQPINVNAKVTVLPFKTTKVYLGGSVSFDTGYFLPYENKVDGKTTYTLKSNNYNMSINGNFVYYLRKKLPFRSLIDIHAGVGVFGLAAARFEFDGSSSNPKMLWSMSPSFTGGVAFQSYFSDQLYMEFGADVVDSITFEKPTMNTFYVKPSLSVGWKF